MTVALTLVKTQRIQVTETTPLRSTTLASWDSSAESVGGALWLVISCAITCGNVRRNHASFQGRFQNAYYPHLSIGPGTSDFLPRKGGYSCISRMAGAATSVRSKDGRWIVPCEIGEGGMLA